MFTFQHPAKHVLQLSKCSISAVVFPTSNCIRKLSKKLASRKEYLYGITPCFAAIMAARRTIFKIYLHEKLETEPPIRNELREIIDEADTNNIAIHYKSKTYLDRMVPKNPHQNVVMEVGKLTYKSFTQVIEPSDHDEFWLAVDQVKDPMNLGAILRSATYFGVQRVIVNNKNSCPATAVVSKASSGAMEWVPIYGVNCMKKFLKRQTAVGWNIIGSMSSDENRSLVSCENLQVKGPSILVVGNEGIGLDEDVIKLCSQMVSVTSTNSNLPLGLDSLNVSVATGVMLHSLVRKVRQAKELTDNLQTNRQLTGKPDKPRDISREQIQKQLQQQRRQQQQPQLQRHLQQPQQQQEQPQRPRRQRQRPQQPQQQKQQPQQQKQKQQKQKQNKPRIEREETAEERRMRMIKKYQEEDADVDDDDDADDDQWNHNEDDDDDDDDDEDEYEPIQQETKGQRKYQRRQNIERSRSANQRDTLERNTRL